MREAPKPYGSHQEGWYDGPARERHSTLRWMVGIVILLALGLAAFWINSKAKAQPTVALPFATVTSVGTTSTQIIGYNPSRRSLQICTPASTVAITIAPLGTTPVSLTTGITIVGTATSSTCFTPPAYLLSSGTAGGAGAGWNAIGASSTSNVTVLEW